jgi:hypothetical protein
MVVALFLGFAFGAACLYGWFLMLVMGALHTHWASVPALGFWLCVGICALLGLFTGGGARASFTKG